MDPIAVLHNRIQMLEAKLGLSEQQASMPPVEQSQQGDSVTGNLVNASAAIHNATAGHEKLGEAMHQASELNNYADPNLMDTVRSNTVQQNIMKTQEVVAADQMIRHHCQCMHHCKQTAPVLESEPIQQVPQMQITVNNLHASAEKIQSDADQVSEGVTRLAETCGSAAISASEEIANVAQKVEQVEEKMFPRRRNGLD